MNLHQLKIFYAVAQCQSITEAGINLNISQPAVSLQVKALERELGINLFDRGGRRLKLTQAGEVLYQCAVSIFHAKDEAERVISELSEGTRGKLILGANTTGGMYVLPRIIRAFLDVYPQTEIILRIESTNWIYENILQNVLDMGFVGGPTEDRRFGIENVCLDQLVIVVSPSHPLAKVAAVAPSKLAEMPCVAPTPDSRTRRFFERNLRDVGVTLQIAMELSGTEAVKRAAEANLGFGIVSGYSVEQDEAAGILQVVPLKGLKLERHMELIYRKQKYFSPVAKRFLDFALDYAREHLMQRSSKARKLRKRSARIGGANKRLTRQS